MSLRVGGAGWPSSDDGRRHAVPSHPTATLRGTLRVPLNWALRGGTCRHRLRLLARPERGVNVGPRGWPAALCVRVCVRVFVGVRARVAEYLYVFVCVRICLCVPACASACACLRARACVFMCLHARVRGREMTPCRTFDIRSSTVLFLQVLSRVTQRNSNEK